MDFALEVKNLSLNLNGKLILHDLNLKVRAGASLSLVGPNGAGKTSLLSCILRLHEKWRGEISLLGQNTRQLSRAQMAQLVSYVPQVSEGRPPFTVSEFLSQSSFARSGFFSSLGFSGGNCLKVAEVLELTGLGDFADSQMSTLSGGECQLVFIAAALVQDTPVIILDEPATFLDFRYQQKVMEIVDILSRQRGNTVISVHHDINTAANFSDHIVALQAGTIAFDGSPEDFLQSQNLEKVFGAAFQLVQRAGQLPLMVPAIHSARQGK